MFNKYISLMFRATMLSILFITTTLAGQTYDLSKAKSVVGKVFHNNVEIEKTFKGPGNLVGMLIQKQGEGNQPSIVYADKNGQYVVLGTVLNKEGQDITSSSRIRYVDDAKSYQALKSIEGANWFEQGNPKASHQIYVFAEPNCSACNYFYGVIKPYVAQGKLTVRWVMVAFLKPSSLGKAAAILSSKNPVVSFDYDEMHFNKNNETGGISPLKTISSNIQNKIQYNMKIMGGGGFDRTPIIIFKSESGKPMIIRGAPSTGQMHNIINQIGKY